MPIKPFNDTINPYAFDVKHLMPYDEPGFKQKRSEYPHITGWGNRLFRDWFFTGLESLSLYPKEGIDSEKAMNHIRACMTTMSTKHEDKEAACAFLFEEWFEETSHWKTK